MDNAIRHTRHFTFHSTFKQNQEQDQSFPMLTVTRKTIAVVLCSVLPLLNLAAELTHQHGTSGIDSSQYRAQEGASDATVGHQFGSMLCAACFFTMTHAAPAHNSEARHAPQESTFAHFKKALIFSIIFSPPYGLRAPPPRIS